MNLHTCNNFPKTYPSTDSTMFISSSSTETLLALTFLSLYVILKIAKRTINKTNTLTNIVPEPSGALPIIGHLHLLWSQEPVARILGAFADKCGPIYSLKLGQQRVLILSNWEMVKECFTKNDKNFANRPSIAISKYLAYDSAAFALSPYGQYWRDIRKLATIELLSTHRLELLKHIRASEVDSFIKDLNNMVYNHKDKVVAVNLSELLEHLTFNLNVRLIAGKRFSESDYGEENSEAWRVKKAIKEALHLTGVFVLSDAIPWLEWFDSQFGYVSSMKRTFKELDLILGNWLEEHRLRRSEKRKFKRSISTSDDIVEEVERDLMHVMISKLYEDGQEFISGYSSDTVIKANAMILILTGSESTAVTLTWALSLLLNHPKVLKKAQEELDVQIGRERWVQESDIDKLIYLQAIIKETLRVNPAGPITGPREATEDCHIGNYFIPKGTRLTVNIWKVHRDPSIWLNPCEFQPERFLTSYADMSVKGQKNYEYIPFSLGRRSCPGMTLGLAVVHLILARLLQGFDMRTIDGKSVDMREGLGIALPKLTSLEVVLAPRLPQHLYESL